MRCVSSLVVIVMSRGEEHVSLALWQSAPTSKKCHTWDPGREASLLAEIRETDTHQLIM